jgi:tripartite ATP-independent transporter DctM subunit
MIESLTGVAPTWQLLFAILIGAMAVSLLVGQWIAFALGTVGTLLIFAAKGALGISAIGSIVWNTGNSYILIAIPLFLLMGELILRSGVSLYFYRGVGVLLERLPGGLYHANIGACALFAAICGSSVATAATIGTVAIPELLRRGYDRTLLFGSIAAGGTLGILIPPSIPMILYGALVSESVPKLFMAGMIPGVALALVFSIYIAIRSLANARLAPRLQERSPRRDLREAIHVVPVVVLLGIVLGGIYAGIFTPTEGAAVGVAGAFAMAAIYRRLSVAVIREAVIMTVRTTGMVMLIVVSAQILSAALTFTGVSRGVSEWIYSIGLSKWTFFLALVVLYIVLGCFVEGIAMIYITLPVLYPAVQRFGFDPIWFGVVLVILIELGQIHPPMGINLFTIQAIAPDSEFSEMVIGALPFVFLILAMVGVLCLVPSMALWLPSLM